jgi:hypothetical protein
MTFGTVHKSTCYHEAGHAIAWMALTGEAPYYIYHALLSAGVQLFENRAQPVPDDLLPHFIVQILAGPIAQARFQGRKFEQIWQSSLCLSDNEALDHYGVELTGDLVPAARAIIKDNWKAVDGLAKLLIENGGRLHGHALEYWLAQVQPAECNVLLKELAQTTKAARESAKSFIRVWDSYIDESLTFISDCDHDEQLCYWLMEFVRDDVGGDKDIAALLETATGIKVDLTAIEYEDRFDEHAKDIIRMFFERSPRYRVLKHSKELRWLKDGKGRPGRRRIA